MRILVADDDRTLADVIAFALKREGYDVILAEDGEAALQRWEQDHPDLVLLDINMPKLNGFSVCRRIRDHDDTPIILLTVLGEEEHILRGLNLGADDYITKPFSPRQLVARVRAVMRRARQAAPVLKRQVGHLSLDLNRRELSLDQSPAIQLTALELRLMDCLMINVGQVVSSEILIDYIWGSWGGDMDMLRQVVHRLRGKIGADVSAGVRINNIPGTGYELVLLHIDQ